MLTQVSEDYKNSILNVADQYEAFVAKITSFCECTVMPTQGQRITVHSQNDVILATKASY